MKYQLIMHRLLEPGREPDITRGTLEGTIKAGDTTLFRLQGTVEADLKAYVAEGEVLNINPKTFGGTGVFAIPEMDRFYRHVLLEHRFPHHTGAGFRHAGKTLFEVCKMVGADVFFNQPGGMLYPTENPF
jgi:L-fucose isomerase-like protein